MVAYALNLLRSFWHDDRAQDAFEYLLVIGGVTVAVIAAMALVGWDTMISAIIDGVCGAIKTLSFMSAVGDCTPA